MVVHGDYVYKFGGVNHAYGDVNKAERMKIGEWRWNGLPNMKEARRDFGIYISENRIYLIGGYNNTTIEYYDVQRNFFNLSISIQVSRGGIVCSLINDKIYSLGVNNLKVFTKDFKYIQSLTNIKHPMPYCFSDVIVRGYNFIYFNSNSSNVKCFDSASNTIRELKSL
jgi:hypothetical protein